MPSLMQRCTFAAALAALLFIAAVAMTLSVLALHGSHHLTVHHESVKESLPSFVSEVKNKTSLTKQKKHSETTTQNTTSSTCFSLNSLSWLQGPRLGNAPLDSNDGAIDLILNTNIPSTLEQSLCHKDSSFLDWNNVNDASLNIAALRLIYLAFHVHQHEPAWKEARHRLQYCTSADMLVHSNIGNMDYECPDAKFLVVPLGVAGLGAIMRLTVVNALLAGMATQRVVLFVNNAHDVGPSNIRESWPHASCDRHDMQCFFLASSPCVLTEHELANAHVLERSEMRQMFRRGEIPGPHGQDRVVITKVNTRPHMAPQHLRENLVEIAKTFIIPKQANAALLERAAELIYEIEPLEESRYYYFGRSSKVHHGAVYYAMRPRPEYAERLNHVVESTLPDGFDPHSAIGLPIRGSDKCTTESECLTFDQYMKAMAAVWKEHHVDDNGVVASIILTTEDERVVHHMKQFDRKLSFPYRFITNTQDVLQGTGVAKEFEKKGNFTADQVMLSSVAALKLQLSAKYAVGNCCSNFHNLLFDFLRDGCGAARNSVVTCLQEMEETEFRMCCSWDKSDECQSKRQAATNKTARG